MLKDKYNKILKNKVCMNKILYIVYNKYVKFILIKIMAMKKHIIFNIIKIMINNNKKFNYLKIMIIILFQLL